MNNLTHIKDIFWYKSGYGNPSMQTHCMIGIYHDKKFNIKLYSFYESINSLRRIYTMDNLPKEARNEIFSINDKLLIKKKRELILKQLMN